MCWGVLQTFLQRIQNMYQFWRFHLFDVMHIRPFIVKIL